MLKKHFYSKFALIIKIVITSFLILLHAESRADITPSQKQQIQTLLDHWRARLGIPATTLSISLPESTSPITFVSGTTTLGGSEKITPNTLFQAGSITKSFTSMILLQLEDQGKIDLDDSISKYLPQYSKWRNITIRQLLNHTSGIFDYTKTARFHRIRTETPKAGMTPEQLIEMASMYHPYFPPGQGWKYSNTNYVLAGLIIEQVTQQSIDNIIEYYLHGNEKLHLPNTFYHSGLYSQEEIMRMAHGYSSNGKDVTGNNMSWAFTAGAIVTTTPDLLTWWKNLFQNQILSSNELSQMMSLVYEHTSRNHNCFAGKPAPHLEPWQIDKRYGLGIIQSATRSEEVGTVWWHNGSTQGYKSIVMWYPKSNIYMALMINRDPGYLLNPNLPIVRNTMQVLLKGSCPPTSFAATTPHKFKHKTHHLAKRVKLHHKKPKHITHKTHLAKRSTVKSSKF